MPPSRVFGVVYHRILLYTIKGMSIGDIAKKVGMHPDTVSHIRNTTDFKERFEKVSESLKDQLNKILETEAEAALRKIIAISKDGKPQQKIQLEASKDLLDRAGMKPKEVVETINRNYSPQEIESANATVTELLGVVDRLSEQPSKFLIQKEVDPQELVANEQPQPATTDRSEALPA